MKKIKNNRTMKIVIIILAVIFGIVALLALIGLFIGEHRVSRSAVFNQPVDTVWILITDYKNEPSWRSDITSKEKLPDINGHQVWVEKVKGDREFKMEIIPDSVNKKITCNLVDNSMLRGNWVFELTSSGSGCKLTITENGFVKNPVFRTLFKFFMNKNETIDTRLNDIAKKLNQQITITEEI